MKTRITIDPHMMCVMKQPEGYQPMSTEFVEQYNRACKIVGPLIPGFNRCWPNGREGDEDYEKAYYTLFLICLNSVEEPKRVYIFTSYDGENFEYELVR